MLHFEALIGKMTLAEKCALLSGKDTWHTRAIERLQIPSITLSDGPSGLRKQVDAGDHLGLNASTRATCMASSAAIANSWNEDMAHMAGQVIGREARTQDVQVLLAPGMNVKRSPLCGRNFEYYSEDPYLAGKLAAAYVRGVQENGVAACIKHYAVNSQEAHRMASDSVLDARTEREIYLTNFEIAVKEGKPKCVMSAYNRVNGVYANENTHLLKDVLRDDWGFDGAVITDWGGDNDFVEGVRAGCDLEMPGCGDDSPIALMKAVQEGRISEEIVNQRVDEMLTLIFDTVQEKQETVADEEEAHHRTAERVAEECAVLLKNEDAILPLARSTKLAVIGDFAQTPRFQGAGSSMVNAARQEKTLDLLPEYFPNVIGYAPGFQRLDTPDETLTAQAEKLAADAECVLLYIGLTEGYETEGLDRTHLRLPQNQLDLLDRLYKINPRIVAVVTAGSAVEMPWIDKCRAVLWPGLGGQAAASAVLRVLSGAVNPSGKLAETIPLSYGQTVVKNYYPGAEYTSEYREGLYVGYRYYQTANAPVLFPFGHGLSYTRFAYANLTVKENEARFTLKNMGSCAGTEVAQVYVSLPNAKIFRPKLELKGFRKVHLDAGEQAEVVISLDDKAFRYWNDKTNKWEIEGGTYEISVGASAADLRLTETLVVKGTNAPDPYAGRDVSCYKECKLDAVSDAQFTALLGHKIPQKNWDRSAPLQMNDAVLQLEYAKNPLACLVGRMLKNMQAKSIENGKPDLNLLFIYNIPFRGIGKMMNGMVSMAMAEDLLLMANGHGFKGFGRLVHHYFHRPKLMLEEEKK